MKKLIVVLVLIFWGFIGVSEITAHSQISGDFYTGLSPYGNWIEIDYGVVVWRPTIMRMDWSPYRDGRWIWTSDGWYWQSYEPFGYITYHYGRWYFDDYYGWLWYPDYQWAPAWVEWRYDDQYIGWAPLHPYAIFSISTGIHYRTSYYSPYYHWNFVAYNHFYDPYVYNHCIAPRYRYRVYSNTRYRTNYVYHNGRVRNYGVDIQDVRRRSGHKIRQRDLVRSSDPITLDSRNMNNDKIIRTFYKSRDELVRNEVRDVKITKSDRKSSLDVTSLNKSDLKKKNRFTSNERKRNKNQKDNFTKKERTKTNNDRKIRTSNDRKKSGNDIIRKKNKNDNLNRTLKKNVKKGNDKRINTKQLNSNVNKNIRIQKKTTNTKRFNRKVTNDNKRKVTTQTNNKKKTRINKNTSDNRNKKNVTTKRNENKNKRTTVKKNSGNNNKQNKRSKR